MVQIGRRMRKKARWRNNENKEVTELTAGKLIESRQETPSIGITEMGAPRKIGKLRRSKTVGANPRGQPQPSSKVTTAEVEASRARRNWLKLFEAILRRKRDDTCIEFTTPSPVQQPGPSKPRYRSPSVPMIDISPVSSKSPAFLDPYRRPLQPGATQQTQLTVENPSIRRDSHSSAVWENTMSVMGVMPKRGRAVVACFLLCMYLYIR